MRPTFALAVARRHDPEGRRVGDRDHVGLLDRVEAGDRRAVEAHAVVERALELVERDREALQVPLDVGEPEEEVVDALLLHPARAPPARLRIRRRPCPALDHAHRLPPRARLTGGPDSTLLPFCERGCPRDGRGGNEASRIRLERAACAGPFCCSKTRRCLHNYRGRRQYMSEEKHYLANGAETAPEPAEALELARRRRPSSSTSSSRTCSGPGST